MRECPGSDEFLKKFHFHNFRSIFTVLRSGLSARMSILVIMIIHVITGCVGCRAISGVITVM